MRRPTPGATREPTDAATSQLLGKRARTRTRDEDWPSLLRRCDDLGIRARQLDSEHESFESALAAIDAAKKAPKWKTGQRKKLRQKIQYAIAEAEAVAAPSVADNDDLAGTDEQVDDTASKEIEGEKADDDPNGECELAAAHTDGPYGFTIEVELPPPRGSVCDAGANTASGSVNHAASEKSESEESDEDPYGERELQRRVDNFPYERQNDESRWRETCKLNDEIANPLTSPSRRLELVRHCRSTLHDVRVALCPHGYFATDDWRLIEGDVMDDFSSGCNECLGKQLAFRACDAALAAVAPPDDPDDPYGGGSADCFYEKPPADGGHGTRRLAGGLHFALPDEVYDAEGNPLTARAIITPLRTARTDEGLNERPKPHGLPKPYDEHEPDWAPYMTVVSPDGLIKVVAKASDFYYDYDAAAGVGFTLMKHNASFGSTDGRRNALYRWLEEPPTGEPPLPPPPHLPQPPVEAPVEPELAVQQPPLPKPPRRSHFTRGTPGRRAFRRERAEWYMLATGIELEGSVAEQHEAFHDVTRKFRAYSGHRSEEARLAEAEKEEREREQMRLWYDDAKDDY